MGAMFGWLGSVRLQRIWWERFTPWASTALLAALVLVPISIFGWLVFYTDVFEVQAITVVDAREHTTEAVRQLAELSLQEDGRFRPGRSLLFLQPQDIEHRILHALPQVRSVDVRRQLPGTLKVIVQEKTPALLLFTQGHYYFVDHMGIAYEEARLDTLPGLVIPTVKNHNPDSVVTVGTPVLSESFVVFVGAVSTTLPEVLETQVVEVETPSLAAREVQFRLSNNWRVRFDVTRPAEYQLKLLHDLVSTTIPPEKKPLIEYIDLRIPQRIYYKTRDPNAASASQ